jgi:hypothetical protein
MLALTVEKNKISTFPMVMPFCGEKGQYTYIHKQKFFFFIWFVRLLALRPLLAYCASLG